MEVASIGGPALWAGFLGFVLAMLLLDLGVFHRKSHAVSLKEAAAWSAVWVALALLFNAWIWHTYGAGKGLEFATGYLIEKALSVDNIFVFAIIFSAFAVPQIYQHRILFWGILGALVMRAAFILAGGALLARFHWMIWLFGALLAVTGVKLLIQRDVEKDPNQNPIVRLFRRLVPTTAGIECERFIVKRDGRRRATPLLIALVAVEATDVVFAIDSIPAIFAITQDPFIVFTSNIFAILGLRSLYFLLAGVLHKFRHLKIGLAGVLVFVGGKMMLMDVYEIPVVASLVTIAAILGVSIATSLVASARSARGGGAARDREHPLAPDTTA